MSRCAVHVGFGHEVVEIHLRDAPDRVDERNRIGAASFCREGGVNDVRDIWRELDDDGLGGDFHYPSGDFFRNIGILTDG